MGPNPLTSNEVMMWCARRRITLEPFEHDIIDQLDALYLSNQNKKERDA